MQEQQSSRCNRMQMHLETLFAKLPLTKWYTDECYACLLICLEHHEHKSKTPTDLYNLDGLLAELDLVWSKPLSDSERNIIGHTSIAAERAAEGIACIIIRLFTEYNVIKRVVHNGGFDFWLSRKEDDEDFLFQNAARLECKGRTFLKRDSQVRQLARDALGQTNPSDCTGKPAYAVVAEFSRPIIYLVEK